MKDCQCMICKLGLSPCIYDVKFLSMMEEKINKLEQTSKCQNNVIHEIHADNLFDMKICIERIDKIEKKSESQSNKIPYKCPVCDGKGQWFEEPSSEYHCNSCVGTGIVWG